MHISPIGYKSMMFEFCSSERDKGDNEDPSEDLEWGAKIAGAKGEGESLITDNGNANQKWAGIAETRTWLDEEASHDDYRDTKTRVEDTRRRYQVIVASLWRCYMHTVSRSLHFLNSAGVSRGAH